MTISPTITRDDDASRYELHDGTTLLAVLDYRDNGTDVALTRAFTVPTFRSQGHAATLTAGAVADIAERGGAAGGRRVVPLCWYVAQWFDEHPEQSHLLAPR
ncbi:N-acetyltransferase [Micrococcus sp. EYE_162]|uniref:GNAT family N-acetyltransferase n=1 Tax=unclassified Micrococcus TaxID=2620948 RepID=UPI002004D4E1|nr:MULTISPECIES: GNAT family N-acetyltransferase [unclassified Micrococcus]MCK6096435.1 N-acetyltransferase [Micrococcus sp. EYE_212]MCK6172586.1 N-acetyltransferase [Micrococcus sp. EYE_162]